jgi:hypothetical protein
MPILFDIVETTEVEKFSEKFEIRLIKRGEDDWGVDNTYSMNPVFGYNEQGARRTYGRIVESFTKKEEI